MSILNRSHSALFPFSLVALAIPLAAQPAPLDDTYQGEAAERYAMVRTLEGDVTIRKGEVEELLARGTPVAEGDILESRGRGVLQLADGTRIAFDGNTRLHLAALFKNGQGERQILLRLDYGRIRLNLGGEARVRVDTPSGTLTLDDRAVATLEAERDRTVRVRVASGRGTFRNNRDEARLSAGERIATYSSEDRLDRVRTFNTYDVDPFESWADRSAPGRRGESYQRVPREIRHYADDLDANGDWVEVEDAGWCWRPRVELEWRPYWRGRWGAYSGGLTWVSDDPFGYLTFHFGRWGWTSRWGWYWIPGVHYSPAWVAWNAVGTHWGWAPLDYWNGPSTWGYGAWSGGHCWNVVNVNYLHQSNLRRHIYSDANVLRTFNASNRDLRSPWTRGPVVVTQAELRNPAQLNRVLSAEVRQERIKAYERQIQGTTGRVIVRREATPTAPGSGANPRDLRVPFEDRRRDQGLERREASPRDRAPEVRPTSPRPEAAPTPARPRERGFEVRPDAQERPASPRERPMEPREERRPDSTPARPRERGFEARPDTREERRPDPPRESPRERVMEPRPSAPREERRPDPPRERSFESRPSPPPPRQEQREERRPDPPRESRPTPPSSDRRESRNLERRN